VNSSNPSPSMAAVLPRSDRDCQQRDDLPDVRRDRRGRHVVDRADRRRRVVTISTLIVALYVGMAILVFTTSERVERSGGSLPRRRRSRRKPLVQPPAAEVVRIRASQSRAAASGKERRAFSGAERWVIGSPPDRAFAGRCTDRAFAGRCTGLVVPLNFASPCAARAHGPLPVFAPFGEAIVKVLGASPKSTAVDQAIVGRR